MFTILKKELKAFLRRPLGILFVAISCALAGLATAVNNIYDGIARSEYSLAFLAMALALMLPIAVKDIFTKDRKSSVDRLYLSLGFSSAKVVLGKYGALLTLIGIETAMLLIIPFILSLFADINFASAYLSLLCFILFAAAMAAMNVFIASASKNAAITLIASYAATVFSFVIYLFPMGNSSGLLKIVAKTFRFLSPFSSVDTFISGAFDIASLLYLLLLTAVFSSLAIRSYKKRTATALYGKKSPERKTFKFSPAFASIVTVIAIVLSTLVSLIPAKYSYIDISTSKIASLSAESKKYIGKLTTDVDIYVVNSNSSDKAFEHLLESIDSESDHIDVIYSTQKALSEKLYTLGWDGSFDITPYTVIIESDKRVQVVDYSSMVYYENSDFSNLGRMDESAYLNYLLSIRQEASNDPATYGEMLLSFETKTQKYSCAEALLMSCIEYTSLEYIPEPYYVTGHGEIEETSSILCYVLQSSGFSYTVLDLTKVSEVPQGANCLIINAPENDFSKEEADFVINYLKNGGAMTLITNEANLSMPNLMSIVNAYGVSAEKGIVCFDHPVEETEETDESEENSQSESSTTQEESTEETETRDKNSVEVSINSSHDSLYDLSSYSVFITDANHITISDQLGKSVIVTKLMTTSAEAYIDGVENSAGEKTLAVAIEEETANGTTEIAWFTGASSYDGDNAEEIALYASIYSVVWGGEDYVSEVSNVASKLLNDPTLDLSSGAKLSISATLFVIIPAAIAVLGLVNYNKRKKITAQNV